MYYVGQTFDSPCSPQVIEWCNENNCHIEVDENRIRTIVENDIIPEGTTIRSFSKFKIWSETVSLPFTLPDGTQAYLWDLFEQFLVESKLRVGYEMLDVLEEDNDLFTTNYPKACELFGKELIDSILEKCVVSTRVVF